MTDRSSPKPTPVRQTLPGRGPGDEVRFASARFETDAGETWWVEELGYTRSGRREDPGVPLLLLGFRRDGAGEFEQEALVPARRLADVPVHALPDLLARTRPFRNAASDREFFAEARGRTRDGRSHRRGKRPR